MNKPGFLKVLGIRIPSIILRKGPPFSLGKQQCPSENELQMHVIINVVIHPIRPPFHSAHPATRDAEANVPLYEFPTTS